MPMINQDSSNQGDSSSQKDIAATGIGNMSDSDITDFLCQRSQAIYETARVTIRSLLGLGI